MVTIAGRLAILVAGLTALAGPAFGQEDTVKIGVDAAQTGAFVSAGNTIGAGVTLAAKEINDAGGIKIAGKTYKIDLQNRDNRTDVNVAIAAARELVEDIGVSAIYGTETHDFSVSMTKITGPAKVLQFTGNSSLGAILTEEAVAPGGPLHYTFQTEPPEFQRSGSTARGVLKLLGKEIGQPLKKAVVFVADDATGQYLSAHYVKALEAEGQQVELIKYPPSTTDFTPLLTRAKSLNPDTVHFWYNGDITLIAFPQAVQLNVAKGYFLFGVDPGIWAERKLVSTAPVTLSCVPMCWGAPPSPEAKAYFDRYFAAGAAKGVQSSVSLLYYDYVHWYAKALEEAGTTDPDKVVAQLEGMKYQGVVSKVPLYFDKRHRVTFATEVCLVKPNTSDQFECAVEEPPAEPPAGDNAG
ncbi:ABC transporter substrate-binding protein [Labrys wisconsinensis]|uniref:ABC-type branched-subunit amino acid transport system substrate-binding protein n=1 Tax=Labrys wisconsinensis TaxID=425677 RepID=A0ABU0J598_9HYPH|nr:ABC transporter substrate-binding protein [Labrys wisconsinensis]MDQ0469434.1 ABC-type branched-subunit amino acid transport system substrate-binding protein [Labrys wisconsinensis]